MIPEKEKVIFEKIEFTSKYLHIREKYINDGNVFWLSKKSDVLQSFNELNYKVDYVKGGAYVIKKEYNNYSFEYRFIRHCPTKCVS